MDLNQQTNQQPQLGSEQPQQANPQPLQVNQQPQLGQQHSQFGGSSVDGGAPSPNFHQSGFLPQDTGNGPAPQGNGFSFMTNLGRALNIMNPGHQAGGNTLPPNGHPLPPSGGFYFDPNGNPNFSFFGVPPTPTRPGYFAVTPAGFPGGAANPSPGLFQQGLAVTLPAGSVNFIVVGNNISNVSFIGTNVTNNTANIEFPAPSNDSVQTISVASAFCYHLLSCP